jgi:hypothetical protein
MGRHPARRHPARVVLAALLAVLAVAALAIGSVRGHAPVPPQARLTAARAAGALAIADSRAGAAVLEAGNLAPGHPVSGAVTIGNAGAVPGALSLSLQGLRDQAGPGGGVLSGSLRLLVRDVTGGSEAVLYRGPLAAMPRLDLGILGPDERRRYSFQALLPESSVPDNSTQGARSSFDLAWALSAASAAPCAARLPGGTRSNLLLGGAGGDLVTGYLGADEVRGGGGDDCVVGGPGSDRISGGPGADLIRARDGSPDRIDCGPGRDRAIVDRFDRLRAGSCETVVR